jgi:hypothetical protein
VDSVLFQSEIGFPRQILFEEIYSEVVRSYIAGNSAVKCCIIQPFTSQL